MDCEKLELLLLSSMTMIKQPEFIIRDEDEILETLEEEIRNAEIPRIRSDLSQSRLL